MIRIHHVLCPVDLSDVSQHALDHAAAVAHWYDARLTVLYVFANMPAMDLPPLVLEAADRARLRGEMQRMAARVPSGVDVDFLVIEAERVHEALLETARERAADLVVIGTHGRSGFQRLFLGSVTEKVIRKAECPLMVVPPRAPDVNPDAPVQFRRIICAVDFSRSSLSALGYALDLAEEADARLTLLHVIEIPPELREHVVAPDFDVDRIRAAAEAEALRRLRELIPEQAHTYCTVRTAVVEGSAYRELLRQAAGDQADLIVMGVRGRGAIDMLVFGSTTHHVIRAATCPVLVVRDA